MYKKKLPLIFYIFEYMNIFQQRKNAYFFAHTQHPPSFSHKGLTSNEIT